ncbi:MAG: metallophosphoesterase [Thermoplasmatota archaeon]
MDRVAAVAALALLVAAGLAACAAPDLTLPSSPTSPAPPPKVRFLAFGDAGTGAPQQAAVAAAMAKVCAELGCDFALDLGDNIYEAGASRADDPQFDTKFERPYANLTIPVWLVLGNHDNGDPGESPMAGLGAWYQTGNNEVAYSARTDRASDKWHMPARYYNVSAEGVVDFLALDTNTLVYEDLPVPPDLKAKVREQTDWVDGAVAAAKSPWRIALGHHPYVSNGPHGNAGSYDGKPGVPGLSGDYLKQFFEAHLCGKIDVYLSGHDHDLEWLDPVASCGHTEFVVSGGGGADTYPLSGSGPTRFQAQTFGFWWFEATPQALRLTAFDGKGNVLHEAILPHA